jgi:ParB-like nuclease domain
MNKTNNKDMNLNNLEFHELANVFPLISEEQTKELADDIKKTGLIEPLVLFEDKILDGRNRYNAAKLANYHLSPDDVVEYDVKEDGDPLVFVYSKNILRRHLTVGQRATIGDVLKERMSKADGKAKDKTKKAAEIAGVAASSVEQAGFVKKHAPDAYDEVKKGKKTLHKAMTEAAKKAAAEDLDKAWDKIQAVCGKSFVGALKEDQIAQLTTPKNIQAFADLPDEKMKAVVPVLKLGWKLNRAITFLDKEITPASTISQTIDLFVFKGSKRYEFEMDGVKFVMTKTAAKTNGEKEEKD